MRILLLSEVFPPQAGGSGRWFWELYRRLPDLDVHVVAAHRVDAGLFDAQSELPISRLHLRFKNWGLLDPRGGWDYARALVHLNGLVSRFRPDVVHCGKCLPEGLLALGLARARGVPFCCYAHGEELTLAHTSRELRWLSTRVLHAADRVIANSEFTQKLLISESGVAPERVVVMHPGVDTSRFAPAGVDASVRARLGWAGRRVVLTVGALQKRKGQDMLIRALPAIRARCPDVLYSVAGEGWERAYLDQVAANHGVSDVVQFRGMPRDDELVECYQQCDVFALPNRQVGWDVEGFGIVLLEAQACGRAVIAGLSGGTADTMQPNVTGQLVPCDSPDQLADAVVGFLADRPRTEQFGSRAREWVVGRFDWEVLARQARAVFSEIKV